MNKGKTTNRMVLTVAVIAAALVLASGLAVVSTVGLGGSSVAQAQEAAAKPPEAFQGNSAEGAAKGPGVPTSIEPARSQVPPTPPGEVQDVPLGETERGKAALERALRGDVVPSEAQKIVPSEPTPSDPNQQQSSAAEPAGAPQTEAAVPSTTTFQGATDTNWRPPDSTIAAGPDNLVVATNGALNILDKEGNRLASQTLGAFFEPLGTEHSGAFDPWLAYDPYINRFWLVAVSSNRTDQGHILVGLSDTNDAMQDWTIWEMDARLNNDTTTTNWCDYPKLGFDTQAIYITCNMFAFNGGFQHSKLRVMAKDQFVNHAAQLRFWDYWNFREGNAATQPLAFTVQPAQMFGAQASDGGYLVSARGSGGTGSALDVWRVNNPQNCCDGNATTTPTITHKEHAVGTYGRSGGAQQRGTTTLIDNGDSRLLYAFWQDGKLSTGHTVACGTNGADACAAFKEFDVSSYPTTVSTVNDWVYGQAGVDYYYPAVAPNADGNKTMVFSRSSSSEFASTGYVGIPSSSSCTTCAGPEATLRQGANSYVNVVGTRNRWGDYSGASPDPNGGGVWVAGEFAAATQNTWGVQVGLHESETTSKIVFASNGVSTTNPGDYEIYSMSPEDDTVRQLTNNDTDDHDPVLSPDGTRIAYTNRKTLYVMNVDGSNDRILSRDMFISEEDPTWSPDGTKIAFAAQRFGTELGVQDIWMIDADPNSTTPMTQLTSTDVYESDPAWSPDGTKIAYVSEDNRDASEAGETLSVMRADGTEQTVIRQPWFGGWGWDDPAWSPDGDRIAMTTSGPDGYQIAAINSDGSNEQFLTPYTHNNHQPAWSPDGSKMAFASDRDDAHSINDSEIYAADITNLSAATRLTFWPFQDEEPHWGPIGEYTPRRGTFEVQPPEPPGRAETTITSGPSGRVRSTTASFGFSSSEPGSTFECSLDGKAFSACTSPKGYTGLSDGEHTFRVRAIDTSGKADTTPASRTWTVDITAPSVLATSPPDGTTGVARSANVTATFSEAMTASTLNKTTVKVVKKGSTTPMGATVSYDAEAKKVTLNPNVNLASRTTYTATIKGGSTGVKDLVGNPLAQDKVWSFTTAR